MSDIEVPFGAKVSETAVLLLAAAEELGLGQEIVRTSSKGFFIAPQEVVDKAFPKNSEQSAPTKKTAAKKAAPKKKESS